MKLIAVLLFCMVFQIQAGILAQTITIEKKQMAFVDLLREIKKQTGYNVVCSSDIIKNTGAIDVQVRNMPLKQALAVVLGSKNLGFHIEKKAIVVNRKPNVAHGGIIRYNVKSDVSVHQERLVTGLVLDARSRPLAGVTVSVKGKSTVSTSTDSNGRFVLNVSTGETLQFSFIGHLSQEVFITDQREITVIMEEDQEGIEEVVIVGFGEQKKSSVVSAVSSVKGESLRMPTRSLSNNLAGRVAGIIAVQRSGEPGYDNSEFYIRGVSSFAGGVNPLVLVDGVPRSMNDIEPDEIETFTVLKDAAATAIYGAEGANGVVLITSKRGIVQQTRINYRGEYSRLTPTRLPKFASSVDYLTIYNEALRNEGQDPMFSDEVIARYASGEDPDLYPNSNWWNILMRDQTFNTRHTLNFRGGGEKMRFFVSGAYFGESGLYRVNPDYNNNAGLNRYNLRSNIDIDVTKTTLLRVDLSGQYLTTNYPGFSSLNIVERLSRIPPHLFPAVYSDGKLPQHPSYTGNRVNPYVQLVESGYQKEWRSGVQSRVDIEQKLGFITEGLKIKGAISYDSDSWYTMSRTRVPDTFFAEGRDENGNLIYRKITNETPFGEPNESNSGNKNLYLETSMDYNRRFGEHTIGGMVLFYQKEKQLHDEALAFRKQAYIGRAVYSYADRYSLEANFGITGSENFAEGYRFGFFPAIGVSWNLAREPYFPESLENAVNSLKIRASIGRTGNDMTNNNSNSRDARFMYRPTFVNGPGYSWGIGSTGATNGLGQGLVEGRFAAPSLSWEIEQKRNIGLDVSLWNNRVELQIDYFNNHRTDILLQRKTISGVAGFRQSPWQNYGEVTNKGFDGSLTFNHQVSDVSISAMGTVTFARNKIIEYDEIPQVYPWMNVTGTRLNVLSGMLIADRLFTENDFVIGSDGSGNISYQLKDGIAKTNYISQVMPGDIKYVDLNGDGVIDDFDRVRDTHHPLNPELIYGFGLNLGYKRFYLSAFLQGADNVSVNLNSNASTLMPFHWGVQESNVRQEIVDSRWTAENPSQDVFFPRVRVTEMANTWTQSTWWVRDGSFLRLKNVEAGYSFDTEEITKGKIRAARLYMMGHNIAVWDKIKMYDPELGNSSGGVRYPLPRTWTLGLEVTF